jgi:flagellar protein FlgJ
MGFPVPFFSEVPLRIERPSMPPAIDPNSLDKESPLWQAAQGLEANFLKEMLRNMRKTVQESPETQNNRGLQIFRGMLDDHHAETAAKTQGIGLAEIIVKQVLEMQEAARQPRAAPATVNKSDMIGK